MSFNHASPLHSIFRKSKFVQDQIYAPLGLHYRPAAYPPRRVSGAPNFIDHPTKPRRDERINSTNDFQRNILSLPTSQTDIESSLGTFNATNQDINYAKGIVLADKVKLIRSMLQTGFKITAYLPAWHWQEDTRYDCLMLVKRNFIVPNRNGFDSEISMFDKEYEKMANDLLALPN
ncbi:hypothetical protein [Burkholderia pyrrocinia]|uniref:hypothetical protein n=1 Tax=Burkholderia pyrrocinia TaxID=60550 RepID=UPI001046692C|nr:hypothetical protein [Burkholderia pyrrocinia]TDA47810.1 hypothetical protein EVG18_08860 [Burkholderia pyrrocinia]